MEVRFNTASGKYCCNWDVARVATSLVVEVSIPQAVSTVGTYGIQRKKENSEAFQYRKR